MHSAPLLGWRTETAAGTTTSTRRMVFWAATSQHTPKSTTYRFSERGSHRFHGVDCGRRSAALRARFARADLGHQIIKNRAWQPDSRLKLCANRHREYRRFLHSSAPLGLVWQSLAVIKVPVKQLRAMPWTSVPGAVVGGH